MKKVLLFGDFGKDLDDEVALVVLASYVKRMEAQVVGVVATGEPALLRARIAKGTLEQLGIDAPVFQGSDVHMGIVREYETHIPYLSSEDKILPLAALKDLLGGFGSNEISMIIQCPLTDANSEYVDLSKVSEISLQGGAVTAGGVAVPDMDAYNCAADKQASEEFFKKAQLLGVPIRMLGREAVLRLQLDRSIYELISATGSMVGLCLSNRFNGAIRGLWNMVNDPKNSELPGVSSRHTPEWFLDTFCGGAAISEGEDIVAHVNRVNLYDPLNTLAFFEGGKIFGSIEIAPHVEILQVKSPEETKEFLTDKIMEGLRP